MQTNNQPSSNDSRSKKALLGKVVLLIGNDTEVLTNLVCQLAQRGADIALLTKNISGEAVGRLKEITHSFNQHLLFIDQIEMKNSVNEQLIDNITTELGPLDVFIDLSAQEQNSKSAENWGFPLFNQESWPLTKVVLEEIAQS